MAIQRESDILENGLIQINGSVQTLLKFAFETAPLY